MRRQNESLPAKKEAEKETRKRSEIVKRIKPRLERFCEAAILAGSVAYGKNYSVRKESDIDLIILINRKNADKILDSQLCSLTPQIKESLELFNKKEVDHFSIIEIIDGVKIQFHFWDKAAHYRAERFEKPWPKAHNIFRRDGKLTGTDFTGKERCLQLKDIKEYRHGVVHIYPPYFIDKGFFVLRQPIQNLIMDPDILFTKDEMLLKNIGRIWKEVTKGFIQEPKKNHNGNILFSLYGYWNFSPESKKRVEKRIKEELKKQKE